MMNPECVLFANGFDGGVNESQCVKDVPPVAGTREQKEGIPIGENVGRK